MSDIHNCTYKTVALVRDWIRAKNAVQRADMELAKCKTDFHAASCRLGAWLVPEDAKPAEIFHLWYGSGILAASRHADNSFHMEWRKIPEPKQCAEEGI